LAFAENVKSIGEDLKLSPPRNIPNGFKLAFNMSTATVIRDATMSVAGGKAKEIWRALKTISARDFLAYSRYLNNTEPAAK
jgi:hypothetical protein